MSFQQGLSGLNASSKNLSVIGNNIANANTYGTKTARAEFSDVYAAALNGAGANSIGIGTNLAAVAQQFTQGNISTTENPMDLAINGAGFFQMTDEASPPQYTRNGQFKVNRDGFFVNNSGLRLMGYPADANGVVQPGQAVALSLPTGGVEPQLTSRIDLQANLDSRETATGLSASPGIDFRDASTYNKATSLTVFDLRGQEVALTLYFQKTDAVDPAGPNTLSWNIFATANGLPVGGAPATPISTVVFPADGSAPVSPTDPVVMPQIVAGNNAQGAVIVPIDNLAIDLTRVTQFGSPFGVTDLQQDGFSAGQLSSVSVEPNGIVMARYSNGRSRPAGQIEIANFRNPQGLQPIGDNAWLSTFASNEPVRGVPGDGNLGVLQAGALEESNVDLTGELVNMITAQRIYQANAQTIKAQDQVLQTLVNLR
jgi:flagellar hook protein FlgE